MNDSIDKFLAPLENLSRHPKVRLLTWIVLVGSFIGDTLYSIVDKIQTDGISDNIAIVLMTALIIPAAIYLFTACKP